MASQGTCAYSHLSLQDVFNNKTNDTLYFHLPNSSGEVWPDDGELVRSSLIVRVGLLRLVLKFGESLSMLCCSGSR